MERRILNLFYFILVFLIGIVMGYFFMSGGITGAVVEGDLPSDFLSSTDIEIYDDRVVINVENAMLSNYDSSGSMVPTLGSGVSGITVKPNSSDDVEVGDIISFWRMGELIVHRVVEKGVDDKGVYFVTRGDGNGFADSGVVRWEDVERRLVGIIY